MEGGEVTAYVESRLRTGHPGLPGALLPGFGLPREAAPRARALLLSAPPAPAGLGRTALAGWGQGSGCSHPPWAQGRVS